MRNSPSELKPNTQIFLKRNMHSVRIVPRASSTLGMRKTRSIKVLPSDDSSLQKNAQEFVVEEIGAQQQQEKSASDENTALKVSSPLPIRALPHAITWDNLDERAEQLKYDMSTWKMYDRITTSRMRKVHSTGCIPALKFLSLPEQQRRHNSAHELKRCNTMSSPLDTLC